MRNQYINLLYITPDNALRRKEGNYMCKTLEKLKNLSVEEILKQTNQLNSIPVNLDIIISNLQIKKFSTTFKDTEKELNKGIIKGLVLINNDDVGIFYDKDDSIEEKRFVISHELAHCCLHADSLIDGYVEFLYNDTLADEHEESATLFAMKLLIPEKSLKDTIAKLLLPSINTLSEIFQVPKYIMKKRMIGLNLAYYLDEEDRLVRPSL